MDQKEALLLMIKGIMLAQKRGAFELVEAEMLSQAIKCFTIEAEQRNEILNPQKSNKESENSFII